MAVTLPPEPGGSVLCVGTEWGSLLVQGWYDAESGALFVWEKRELALVSAIVENIGDHLAA